MTDSFGNRLKRLRKKAGLTQEQLAEISGYSIMTIRRWEWGERQPRIDDIKALAIALSVSENELLNDPAPDTNGGWIINIRTATNFTEEAVDLRGNVMPITNITQTPEGASFTVQASWAKLAEIKGLRELFKDIEKIYPALREGGIALGGIAPDDDESENKRRRRKK